MQNFIPNLRLKGIFGPGLNDPNQPAPIDFNTLPQTQPNIPTPVQSPIDYDAGARMKELYQPETQATDRFNSLIENQPQYENPSFLRTVASALSAFGPGGHATGDKVMNWHNNLNQQEWKQAITPAQQAADNERASNVNNRTTATSTINAELKDRADTTRGRQGDERIDIQRKKQELADYKTKNPNVKFDFTGPKVKIVNPGTGQITITDVDTGKMSEMDKLTLGQKNALERIEEQGENAIERTREGGVQSRQTALLTAGLPARTKAPGDVKDESPSATRSRYANAAQKVANQRADLAPFIKLDTGGRFELEKPSDSFWGHSGPTPEQSAELNKLIYGDTYTDDTPPPPPPNTRGQMPVTTPPNSAAQVSPQGRPDPTIPPDIAAKAPPGYRYVRKPGGGYTAVRN